MVYLVYYGLTRFTVRRTLYGILYGVLSVSLNPAILPAHSIPGYSLSLLYGHSLRVILWVTLWLALYGLPYAVPFPPILSPLPFPLSVPPLQIHPLAYAVTLISSLCVYRGAHSFDSWFTLWLTMDSNRYR